MKMSKILSLILVAVMLATALVACTTPDDNKDANADLAGTYNITMWVSEKEGVADQFKEQIAKFMADNPGIVINASIEGVTEADAGSKVVADVATAPDIYCFAQDQLARLVQAAALATPPSAVAEKLKSANDAGSVAAASVAGTLYAYPMTSDNGYFLYYDTSIITEDQADSMEEIIAACEKAGKKFRFALENAWYTASFFFATGCRSNWTMDAEGNFNAVDDSFNSDAGLVSMKGMQKLAQSSCYDSDADTFADAGAIVTGIWNAGAAGDHFGANLGATDLPSFTVDGKSYHLGGYTGYKLMGVKPQTDAKRAAVLSLLAEYLTGKECQTQRAEAFQWGPSNIEAAASDFVQSNVSLAAFAKQAADVNCVPQGQIHGAWWDIAKVLGADAKAAKNDADLKAALDAYDAAIDGVLNMSEDAKKAWSIIGTVNGTNWDTDLPLNADGENTWISAAYDFNVGDQFKVRQGASWDVNFGVDGAPNGGNIEITTAGKYQVKFTYDGTTAKIELVPAQ